MIRQREITKREQLAVERQLFEQRANLRQVKLNLPDQYKEGDEDILINQKVRRTSRISHKISTDRLNSLRKSLWRLRSVRQETSIAYRRDQTVDLVMLIWSFSRIFWRNRKDC